MKSGIVYFAFFIILMFSCAPSKNVSNASTGNGISAETSGKERDGLTFENAIIVKSVDEEYNWIAANYPGAKIESQALVKHNGKPYDVLTFVTKDGETKTAHFDVSKFFGKGF